MGRSLVASITKSAPSTQANGEQEFEMLVGVGDDSTFNALPTWLQTPDKQDHCYIGAITWHLRVVVCAPVDITSYDPLLRGVCTSSNTESY